MDKKQKGDYGENIAAGYLRARGYDIIQENYRAKNPEIRGEIDIIARLGELIVFVEVKFRRQLKYGRPAESITPAKIAHLQAAAQDYLYAHDLAESNCRFDVLEIFGREIFEVNHIENAF